MTADQGKISAQLLRLVALVSFSIVELLVVATASVQQLVILGTQIRDGLWPISCSLAVSFLCRPAHSALC